MENNIYFTPEEIASFTLANATNDGVKLAQPELLITGVGHSGTTYMTKLLKELGFFAGHEAYYSFPWRDRIGTAGIDVSWIGAWYLDEYRGRVWHQVRDPLKVLNSNVRTFEKHSYDSFRFMRAIADYWHPDLWHFFCGWLCQTYRTVEERAEKRFRIEDVDVDKIRELFGDMVGGMDDGRIQGAIDKLSKKTNTHTSKNILSWDDVPDCKNKEELIGWSQKFGYQY